MADGASGTTKQPHSTSARYLRVSPVLFGRVFFASAVFQRINDSLIASGTERIGPLAGGGEQPPVGLRILFTWLINGRDSAIVTALNLLFGRIAARTPGALTLAAPGERKMAARHVGSRKTILL